LFEITYATKQKRKKSRFWILLKTLKNVKVYLLLGPIQPTHQQQQTKVVYLHDMTANIITREKISQKNHANKVLKEVENL